jgi:hypothetical protein
MNRRAGPRVAMPLRRWCRPGRWTPDAARIELEAFETSPLPRGAPNTVATFENACERFRPTTDRYAISTSFVPLGRDTEQPGRVAGAESEMCAAVEVATDDKTSR